MVKNQGMGRGKVFPAAKAQSLLNPLRRLVQSPAGTVAALRLKADSAVLEVGCGPGYFSPHLARAVPDGRLVVLDLQLEMLTIATSRTKSAAVQADAMYLPFAEGSFDAVVVATVLGEVPDPAQCIAELRRILRAGGIAGFAETIRDSDYISPGKLTDLVERHHFTAEDRHGPRWQYVARYRAT